jgi:hypothetical protein
MPVRPAKPAMPLAARTAFAMAALIMPILGMKPVKSETKSHFFSPIIVTMCHDIS